MKKQTFVMILESIQKQYAIDYETGGLITRLGDNEINNHRFVFTTQLIDDTLKALAHEFDDRAGWINYFVYETEFGAKADELHIIKADKSTVKFHTAGDVYDWLIGGEA